MIERPALRYYGGKFRIADQIIKYFPKHNVYLEPCFGAGSVLLQKDRSLIETVNDVDNNVVNFFRVIRERPTELVEAIRYTPWAKTEIMLNPNDAKEPIEKARRFWVQCWMSIAQRDTHPVFRISKKPASQPAAILRQIDYLYDVAERLIGVQIDNLDAEKFIEKYTTSESLIYFDPPYLQEIRSSSDKYMVEMDVDQHITIANLLNDVEGMKIVSGYKSELYTDLYEEKGWHRKDFKALANSGQPRTESLWLCPSTAETLKSYGIQLSMFNGNLR